MASYSVVRRIAIGVGLFGAAIASACGARGPLDIIVVESGPDASLEATVEASVDANDGAIDAVEDTSQEADAGPEGSPIVNCGLCLAQNCGGQVLACITAPACTMALQCVFTMCLASGTPDPTCFANCAGSDPTTQTQVLSLVGCIISNCGMGCSAALGSLGGVGGGGGGGGGD